MWGMKRFDEDSLSWGKEEMTLADLQLMKFELPVIVKVTEGYAEVTDEQTFSSDQLLLLHKWDDQARVLGRKRGEPSLSIPLDIGHPLEVVLPAPEGEEPQIGTYAMKEIVQIFTPPVLCRFIPDQVTKYHVNDLPCDTGALCWFRLVSSHFLQYVIASSVNNGEVDPHNLHYLPISRTLKFRVAKPIQKYTPAKMRRFLKMFFDYNKHLVTPASILSVLGIFEYGDISWMDEEHVQPYKRAPWGHAVGHSNANKDKHTKTNKDLKRQLLKVNNTSTIKGRNYSNGQHLSFHRSFESEPRENTAL